MEKFILASELFAKFEWKKTIPRFRDWTRHYLLNPEYEFDKDVDFCENFRTSDTGRTINDFYLTNDTAKELAMLTRTAKNSKQIRNYLISLDNQKEKGLLLSHDQIKFLTQVVPLFFYDVPRKIAKDRHFKAHNNKYTFYKYRADILGYSKETLVNAMAEIGERYKSEEKALMKLDRHELIRRGVIDLMMALGKDKEHALNIGSVAKDIAKEMNLTFGGWDDRLFKVPNNLRDRIELVLE